MDARGATVKPRAPFLSIACATSPVAFASSTNSVRYFAAASRPWEYQSLVRSR
jgi:hypothetical protein